MGLYNIVRTPEPVTGRCPTNSSRITRVPQLMNNGTSEGDKRHRDENLSSEQ